MLRPTPPGGPAMIPPVAILVGTHETVLSVDPREEKTAPVEGLGSRRPSALAWDPWVPGRAWCGTTEDGVLRSDDEGRSWEPAGLQGERIMALTPSPAERDLVWAGTEPSGVWRSEDAGRSWEELRSFLDLPSRSEWSFPPRPHTHHVRWIACHPSQGTQLWVAVEAGALVSTSDGGAYWLDRVVGSPRDTHELAIHPAEPEVLRVAAGDGYFESPDGGRSWTRPQEGLEVDYLRSVAVDPGNPEIVLISAASRPRSAYVAGSSDGRLYRREGRGRWERIQKGWPDPPDTMAPLLRPGAGPGELWAADERGIHHSGDGGVTWRLLASFQTAPRHLRGLAVQQPRPEGWTKT